MVESDTQAQCQYPLVIVTRVEHCWANIERCECPTLTVLKFNQPHNSRRLITWGPQRASKNFLQPYISCRLHEDVCMCERVICMHVSRFLTFPVFSSKGWRVNYAGEPKPPHLLPSAPLCLPAIRPYLFALWVRALQRMYVCVCSFLQAYACLFTSGALITFISKCLNDKHTCRHAFTSSM